MLAIVYYVLSLIDLQYTVDVGFYRRGITEL